jgi:hypothetical protein
VPKRRIAPIAALGGIALVAACSTSTTGTGAQGIDVEHVKVTAGVRVPGHGLAVLSPDAAKVVVTGDGPNSLCVVGIDGGQKICLDPAVKVDPDLQYAAWSPDGTRIAFTDDYFRSLREPDVWVMDASTGKARDLTDDGVIKSELQSRQDPKARLDLFPSWSPDGKTVRFARRPAPDSTTTDVDAVPATGGSVSELGVIDGDMADLAGLTFSADGTTMAWTMAEDASWAHTVVHIRDVGGGTDRALTATPVDADQSVLSFSPDGEYLLVDSRKFYGQYSCCAKSSAKVYATGGGAAQEVAAATIALFPTWAPAGHALAFTTPIPHSSLRVVGSPGGKSREIQPGPGPFAASNSLRLAWGTGGLLAAVAGGLTLFRLSG